MVHGVKYDTECVRTSPGTLQPIGIDDARPKMNLGMR